MGRRSGVYVIGPDTMLTMSAVFSTGTISMAISTCSIILSRSDSKSSLPKPTGTKSSVKSKPVLGLPTLHPSRLTWRYSVCDPGVLQFHLLHLLIGAKQKTVPFLSQVIRALEVPDNCQLLLQSLHLWYRCRDYVLVMHRDGRMVKPNHFPDFPGPKT